MAEMAFSRVTISLAMTMRGERDGAGETTRSLRGGGGAVAGNAASHLVQATVGTLRAAWPLLNLKAKVQFGGLHLSLRLKLSSAD